MVFLVMYNHQPHITSPRLKFFTRYPSPANVRDNFICFGPNDSSFGYLGTPQGLYFDLLAVF